MMARLREEGLRRLQPLCLLADTGSHSTSNHWGWSQKIEILPVPTHCNAGISSDTSGATFQQCGYLSLFTGATVRQTVGADKLICHAAHCLIREALPPPSDPHSGQHSFTNP